MNEFIPIILGTDNNSYSAASSYFDAYHEQAIVCGSAVLRPFVHSKIAKIYTESDFSKDPEIFVSLLNKVYKEEAKASEKVIFFVPNEDYLFMIYENLDKLQFECVLPYPGHQRARSFHNKSQFYELMESIDIRIPRTWVADPTNKDNLLAHFPDESALFLKADDYAAFLNSNLEDPHKGYYVENRQEGQAVLDEIYRSNYTGAIIVQEFIHGQEGTEYSIMGYRSPSGKVTMSQARALLSDLRPQWVGNHLVLVDSNREDLFLIAEEIMTKLDYRGFYNFDFKIDSRTGEIFVLECNPRLGRSFIYSNFGGINFIELAIEDLIYHRDLDQKQVHPFAWLVVSEKLTREKINPDFLPILDDEERRKHIGNSLVYEADMNLQRRISLMRYFSSLDKSTFPD